MKTLILSIFLSINEESICLGLFENQRQKDIERSEHWEKRLSFQHEFYECLLISCIR